MLPTAVLAAGLLQLGLGVGLLNPAALLAFVEPATTRIEALTGLPALVLGNNVEPALAIAAVLQLYLAYLTLMAVYTNDEKYKRNSSESSESRMSKKYQLSGLPPASAGKGHPGSRDALCLSEDGPWLELRRVHRNREHHLGFVDGSDGGIRGWKCCGPRAS